MSDYVRGRNRINAHKQILSALAAEQDHRPERDVSGPDGWVHLERVAVADAANKWAEAHDVDQRVTVQDVERVETQAMGHVDYSSKLALYVAELLLDEVQA